MNNPRKKIVVANMPGIHVNANGSLRHLVKAGSRWPMTVGNSRSIDYYPFPFGLAYTTALLKRDTSAIVKGLDGVARDMLPGEFFNEVVKEKPDILITELVGVTLKEDLSLLKKIKESSHCIIIVCGYYVSTFPEKVLIENDFIDFSIFGEYEITIKEIIQYLEDETGKLPEIEGLVFRSSRNEVLKNKPRPQLDLNDLPFPDRGDFPPQYYADFAFYMPCISIISSRGCPCSCTFCLDRNVLYNSPAYRMRNAEDVVNEIEYCISQYKANQIYFDDQSFVVDKQRVLKICELIISRNIKIPWTCMGDAIFSDYEMLKMMKEAGCIGIKFGVESAAPEILKQIKKPIDLEKVKQVVRWCKKLGINSHATFCVGLPGETEETIQKSIHFMENLGINTAQVSRAVPYPGTPFFEWAKQNGYLLTEDSERYDASIESVLNYPQISGEKMDQCYKIFLKKVSRKKVLQYLKNPLRSLSFLKDQYQQKGMKATFSAICTFVKRAL